MQEEYLYEGANNYLRLEKKEGYRNELRMLERGRIPGLLPSRGKTLNGVEYLYYEIGSLVNIRDVYLKKKLDRGMVGKLFEMLVHQQEVLSEYLLDERWLLTDPKYLFMDVASGELFFIYYPGDETERWEQYGNLIEFMIRSGDYEDEELIEKIYSFYDLIMCKSFSLRIGMEQMRKIMKKEEGAEQAEKTEPQELPELPEIEGMQDDREEPVELTQNPVKKERVSLFGGREDHRELNSGKIRKDSSAISEAEMAEDPSGSGFGRKRKVKTEKRTRDAQEEMPTAAKFFRLVPIPCALLEIFFLYILMNMNLSRQELVLLAAGAVSAPAMAVVCLFLSKMLREREAEDSEEELFAETERPEETKPRTGLPPAAGHAAGEQEDTKTRFFEGSEQAENKLYGIGKNRRVIRLESLPFIIGKSKEHVDYQLPDSSVSRMHAKFTSKEGKVYLTDLNSTNGTFKNGLRLSPGESTLLEREDEVRLGKLEFAFR